jgi:valyl-tRNA synthetase
LRALLQLARARGAKRVFLEVRPSNAAAIALYDAERVRLDKELKRVEGELAKSTGKLASETFVQNAPAAVVEQERQRLADWTAQRDALSAQRARLG